MLTNSYRSTFMKKKTQRRALGTGIRNFIIIKSVWRPAYTCSLCGMCFDYKSICLWSSRREMKAYELFYHATRPGAAAARATQVCRKEQHLSSSRMRTSELIIKMEMYTPRRSERKKFFRLSCLPKNTQHNSQFKHRQFASCEMIKKSVSLTSLVSCVAPKETPPGTNRKKCLCEMSLFD